MAKVGEKEKTEEVKEAEQRGFLSCMNYVEGLNLISGQVKSFRNLERYAGGINASEDNSEESARLKTMAQKEYQGYCKVYEDCRETVSGLISNPSLRRTLIGTLDQLKSQLDSSYNTLDEFLEGSMKHA